MLSIRCKGLWRECVWDRFVKIWTCDEFGSYLNPHPAAIVLSRALLSISGLLSAVALIFLIMGLQSFTCCEETPAKQRSLRLTCALHTLIGASSSAAIITYAIYVYQVHRDEVFLKIPGFPGFEFGYSFWMAAGGDFGAMMMAAFLAYLNLHKNKLKNATRSEEHDGSEDARSIPGVKSYV